MAGENGPRIGEPVIRVDLHLHTWVSDGAVSPADLVRRAAAAGLDVIAVTDHDTAAGVAEASEAARDHPVRVVPGIEISTRVGGQEFHILGYWIDVSAASIVEHQIGAAVRRYDRMISMVERLRKMGIGITMEDVEAAAGPSARTLGRPHLARALHARRFTRYYNEAFDRYIGDSGPAFVAEGFPTPAEAIQRIHEAGGHAVWAHPPIETFGAILPDLARAGLDGVECYRPSVDADDALRLEDAVRRLGLFPSGGSDWHGPASGKLGEFAVDGARIPEVLDTSDFAD